MKSEPYKRKVIQKGKTCVKELVYLSFVSLVFNHFIVQAYNLLRTID